MSILLEVVGRVKMLTTLTKMKIIAQQFVAAVGNSYLQHGGRGPFLSVLRQALRRAGFCNRSPTFVIITFANVVLLIIWNKHFVEQVFNWIFFMIHAIFQHFHIISLLQSWPFCFFSVGWVKASGERALGKCRDSSTWRQPSDSTRENRYIGDNRGDNLGDNCRLQTQQVRITYILSILVTILVTIAAFRLNKRE